MKLRVEHAACGVPICTMNDRSVAEIVRCNESCNRGKKVLRVDGMAYAIGSNQTFTIAQNEHLRVRILGAGDSLHFEEDEP